MVSIHKGNCLTNEMPLRRTCKSETTANLCTPSTWKRCRHHVFCHPFQCSRVDRCSGDPNQQCTLQVRHVASSTAPPTWALTHGRIIVAMCWCPALNPLDDRTHTSRKPTHFQEHRDVTTHLSSSPASSSSRWCCPCSLSTCIPTAPTFTCQTHLT